MQNKTKLSILEKIIASFDNTADGFSARKLSAFLAVGVAVIATFKFVDKDVVVSTLMVWLAFALLCLGIITAEQLLRYFKGANNNNEPTTEHPKDEGKEVPSDSQPEPKI
jgi:hypothetical protein